jgi:hypothetical protein
MARELSSISRIGRTEPFELQVARGQIYGHSIVHVFGYNPDVDTDEETVWAIDGILGHPASPTIMAVSSSSVDDAAAGTGARTVFIEGVNGTVGLVTEIVTLNGQTAVNTVNTYDAIERLVVLTVGSGGKNAGLIYIGTGTVTSGVPAVPYNVMGIGENNSITGHWTCPVGYTGYLRKGSFSVGPTSGNQFVLGRLKLRGADGITRTASKVVVQSGSAEFDFLFPVKINATECITATAQGSGNNAAVTCYFQIVLVEETGLFDG